jgi:hypothetical protein
MSDNTHASAAVFRRTTCRERANFGFSRTRSEIGSGIDHKILDRNRLRSKPSGGARRDRTDDLLLAKQALSQLSYGPVPVSTDLRLESQKAGKPWLACQAVARARRSPAFALRATAWQPSLRCASEGWWAWEDLNFRPHAYQARALTN